VAWTTWLAIYFIMWWTVLFAVLPWGIRSQHESGDIVPGSDPGAPSLPQLRAKVLWTTVATTVLFGAFYFSSVNNLISLDKISDFLGMPR
jgi:predicted secreted protein